MSPTVNKVEVRFTRAVDDELLVGILAERDRRIYFEYAQSFVDLGMNLSPFRLPLSANIYLHSHLTFGPLPGVFDDSLPDGWGLLLMDRHFKAQGLDPSAASPLDRLAWLGSDTMGALTYHPPAGRSPGVRDVFSLHDLAVNARAVLSGASCEVLPQLVRAGGSPGGACPKVLVGYDPRADTVISGEGALPEGFEPWLVKFSGRDDDASAGALEYAYSRMARTAGVEMPETRLFETKEGESFFGVRRFDRSGTRRLHVHTFGNLIESNFRVPGCDYAQLLKVAAVLTRSEREVLKVFRLMVFNVMAHNRDDHVKNFAFLMDESGRWSFAPAYDLTYAGGPGGEHTMTVAGEGRRPTSAHLSKLAEDAAIPSKVADGIVEEVRAAVRQWPDIAAQVGCGDVVPFLDDVLA